MSSLNKVLVVTNGYKIILTAEKSYSSVVTYPRYKLCEWTVLIIFSGKTTLLHLLHFFNSF